jgi:hypothetical protein
MCEDLLEDADLNFVKDINDEKFIEIESLW